MNTFNNSKEQLHLGTNLLWTKTKQVLFGQTNILYNLVMISGEICFGVVIH